MTFHAYRGNAFEHTHENHAFNRLHDLLQAEWADRDEPLYLFGNFFVDGRELDALVLKRNAIIVVDFKDYGGELAFSENSPWMIGDVPVKGGSSINPYQQIRKNKFALLRHIERRVELESGPNLGHIAGLALFHQAITFDPNELPHNISRWFHIADFERALRSFEAIVSREITLNDVDIQALVSSLDLPPFFPDGRPEIAAIARGEKPPSQRFKPTDSQRRALDAADTWLASDEQVALVVEGMVSTGKRTLLTPLAEKIETTGQLPLLVAPNARIAQRYLGLGHECRSLYTLLYSGQADELVDGRSHHPVRLKREDVSGRVLVFVEAHLLSNSLFVTDTMIYGTGHVLDDLLETLGDEPPKLLVLGDPFQLSRGDLELSLLRAKPIADRGHALERVSLDEQIRPEDSPTELLAYQQALAGAMAQGHYNRLPEAGGSQVVEFEPEAQGQGLGEALVQGGYQAVYLCGKNTLAQQVNRATRSKYLGLPDLAPLAPGDKVDFHNSTPVLVDSMDPLEIRDAWVRAGEIGIVEAVDEAPVTRSIRLKGRDHDTVLAFAVALIRVPGIGSVRVRYLPDYLHAEKPELTTDQLLAMQIWARQEAEVRLADQKARLAEQKAAGGDEYRAERNRYELNLHRLMMTDGYFNAARLRFAYAMTVHRAQGRGWQQVVVNAKESSDSTSPNNSSYFRWLYTASTCTTESLNLLHYPKLNPLSRAQWKANAECQIGPVPIPRQYAYDKQRQPSEADQQLPLPAGFENVQPELVALLLCINEFLHGSEWRIDSIAQHEYQEHYTFVRASGESVKLRFHYDKNYTVTNVVEAASDRADLFDELWSVIEPKPSYDSWEVGQAVEAVETRLAQAGYQLAAVQEHPYRAVLTLTKSDQAAELEVNVNKEGLVSTIRPLRATAEELLGALSAGLQLV